ncbi:PIR protein [Plasmodium ovale]|uniref:PIR protein n=1 Tax=Plasmodium ovale TaxID=36330 RepID=A0A1D3JEN1_PLAOA|nr:PIR protein [Plasmodium ovale]
MYDTFEEYKYNEAILEQINNSLKGKDLSDIYNGSVNEDTEYGRRVIENSITLKNYLLHFDTIESCNNKNCCGYLNYWLNQKARSYNNASYSTLTIYNTYMQDDNELKQKNLCSSKIKYMNFDKYKKMDEIYKIYKSYKYYKIYKSHNSNVQLACLRANSCATEYNKILSSHTKIDDTKLCKVLEDFKKEFELNALLPKGQCKPEIPILYSYQDKCINLGRQENGADTFSKLQGHGEPGERKGESAQTKSQELDTSAEDGSTSPSYFDATLPITLFSSGIGVIFILLSFYKFTPLGHLLKHHIQRFNGVSKNSDDPLYEIHQNSSEYHDRNLEYNEYNILYNS